MLSRVWMSALYDRSLFSQEPMNQNSNQQIENRLTAVREKLAEWEVDGLLIGSGPNRLWLSGFTGSAGWLLVTRNKALLATDFRYWEQAAVQAPNFTLFKLKGKSSEAFEEFIQSAGVSRIGIETEHVTLSRYGELGKIEAIDWVILEKSVEPLRNVKSAAEVAIIRAAAVITDQAMAQVNNIARPGMTERELAWALERWMREAGADSLAFPVIVASGPNGALAHHRPGDRKLQVGDAIVIDMGASLNGYQSDMTRTFHLGSEPDESFWRVYNLVLAAQTAALEQMRPGMISKDIDALARDIITAAGHGEEFGHSLGHGVGLEVHEGPSLSYLREKEVIPAGAVVTVEPGVYISGWGGVRIEDLALLTEEGPELLSCCPKEPVINYP